MSDAVVLTKQLSGGWGLNMTLVPLPSGGVLVYAPTVVGDDFVEQTRRVGEPRVIVAPNHFHHLSLARFREAFPAALAVASPAALPRLAKLGHGGLSPLEAASDRLPAGVELVACEGLKNGEAFVVCKQGAQTTWLVGDAFFNVQGPLSGAMGLALRLTATAPGLKVGRTFRFLAVGDVATYRRWLEQCLEAHPPTTVLPCHGAPLDGPDVGARLLEAARERFG